jgi:hypothetical protein
MPRSHAADKAISRRGGKFFGARRRRGRRRAAAPGRHAGERGHPESGRRRRPLVLDLRFRATVCTHLSAACGQSPGPSPYLSPLGGERGAAAPFFPSPRLRGEVGAGGVSAPRPSCVHFVALSPGRPISLPGRPRKRATFSSRKSETALRYSLEFRMAPIAPGRAAERRSERKNAKPGFPPAIH